MVVTATQQALYCHHTNRNPTECTQLVWGPWENRLRRGRGDFGKCRDLFRGSGEGTFNRKLLKLFVMWRQKRRKFLGNCVSYIFLFLLLPLPKLLEASFAAFCAPFYYGGFIFGSGSVTIGWRRQVFRTLAQVRLLVLSSRQDCFSLKERCCFSQHHRWYSGNESVFSSGVSRLKFLLRTGWVI
jgi:hypothetical protein